MIPTHPRQPVLDSLHLNHPGSATTLALCHHVWFAHNHWSIVQLIQSCNNVRDKIDTPKPLIAKKHSFQMEPVIESNEKVQLYFAKIIKVLRITPLGVTKIAVIVS